MVSLSCYNKVVRLGFNVVNLIDYTADKTFHMTRCLIPALILAIGVTGCKRGTSQSTGAKNAGPPPVSISPASARRSDIGVYVNALGVVTPVGTVAVKSRVDGQLMAVNYEEGQEVRKGDSLVEIDPAPYQAALTQAEGQLARDQALLENARLDLQRYTDALARNAIPKQQLDTQVATVHQYEGTVQLDQGQVDNAKVQLAYCHIAAPISGRVGLRLVDTGNIVHASDANALVVITQLKPITVIFNVAEDYLPQIQAQLKNGNPLAVEAYDRAQLAKIATGALLTLDNQIDTTTGTVKLKAQFENQDGALFPNQFVNARLLVDTKRNVVLLPNPAIQRNAQGAFVYLVKPDQTVAMQTITVGTTDGNESEVEGVEAAAVVASDNFTRLSDGAKIALRSQQGGPKSGKKQNAKP
jgi:multidrug efflux system membrane fusion protein